MDPVTNPHPRAWLYQYNPPGDATWLQDLVNGGRVEWRVVNRAKSTRTGDAVVFWESGPEGGLKGWGEVTDSPFPDSAESGEGKKQRWRVPVRAEYWHREPITRQMVVESQALANNVFMRMSQGASFPLEPHEYAKLMTLMGVGDDESRAMASRLSSHNEVRESTESNSGDLVDMPEGMEFVALTAAAASILRGADFRSRSLRGPTTSTRIFLSAFDPEHRHPARQKSPSEAAALEALHAVCGRFESQLLAMRRDYLARQQAGAGEAGYTENATRLLRAAEESAFTEKAGGHLSADGILAALLTSREGSFLKHLQSAGLSLVELRDQFLRRVTETYPLVRPLWRETFKNEESLPIGLEGLVGQAQLGNDNPWSQEVADSLGAKREADAFAALSTSSSFVPPLAVGVFGNWGSGKSFFMRLVHDRIKVLSDSAKKQKDKGHLGDVVQIRFNAWHYVESNLWASLVDHIFAELNRATSALSPRAADKIFQQLTTARELTISSAEQLMERRKEQAHAAVFVADAEARLAAKQADAAATPAVYWSTAVSVLQEKIARDDDLRRRARLMGIESAIEDVQKLGNALSDLDGVRAQAKAFVVGLRTELSTPGRFASFLALSAFLCGVLFLGRDFIAAKLDFPGVAETLRGWVLALSGLSLGAASMLSVAAARVGKALAFMMNVRDKFRKAAEARSSQSEAQIKKMQDELARLAADVAEGKARFASSTQKVGEAAREYNAKDGRGRLLGFLRSRAAGESYAKHLGLVSTVRKDFEELSDLISESLRPDELRDAALADDHAHFRKRVEALIAKAELARREGVDLLHESECEQLRESITPNEARTDFPTISRIVLYIDDLDRCQPEKVVEVLQAVHLLLSFRLFIVFVAVDVRWVARALDETYPSLLGRAAGAGSASAHDYLEKIFQVPYWVRPMGPSGSTQFMADRLSRQRKSKLRNESQGKGQLNSDTQTAAMDQTLTQKTVNGVGTPSVISVTENTGSTDATQTATSAYSQDVVPSPPAEFPEKAASESANTRVATVSPVDLPASSPVLTEVPDVDLSDDEIEFMTDLARWAGNSPRRLIRFLNIYQVAKATLAANLDFGTKRGDYCELMTQIAIVTGAPSLLEYWHEFLQASKGSSQVKELRGAMAKLDLDKEPFECLDGALATLQKHRSWADAAGLRTYSELSRRFSFGSAVEDDEVLEIQSESISPAPVRAKVGTQLNN